MHNRKIDVLFSAEQIQQRISDLGKQITRDYHGEELVVVGVLKGSFLFMADLVRHIELPLRCDFLRVASYENDKSTGVVRMEFDLTQSIAGNNVLLVEDIVDSGKTLRYLINHLQTNKPKSLKVASLLYKETGNGMRNTVDYSAFECPNRFVIGYGLDSEGFYRNLPYVGAFD